MHSQGYEYTMAGKWKCFILLCCNVWLKWPPSLVLCCASSTQLSDFVRLLAVVVVCDILLHYTVKNIRISTDILWHIFRILTEQVPYTFVSINRWNNEARTDIAVWCRASLFRGFTDTNVGLYGTKLKYGKVTMKYPWIIYEYFLQCSKSTECMSHWAYLLCCPVDGSSLLLNVGGCEWTLSALSCVSCFLSVKSSLTVTNLKWFLTTMSCSMT